MKRRNWKLLTQPFTRTQTHTQNVIRRDAVFIYLYIRDADVYMHKRVYLSTSAYGCINYTLVFRDFMISFHFRLMKRCIARSHTHTLIHARALPWTQKDFGSRIHPNCYTFFFPWFVLVSMYLSKNRRRLHSLYVPNGFQVAHKHINSQRDIQFAASHFVATTTTRVYKWNSS